MRAGPSSFSRLGHLVHVEEASGERYEELEIVSGEWFRVEPLGEREGLTIQTRNFLGKPRVLAIDRHTGRIAQILRLVSLGFQKLPKPSRNLVVQFPNGLQDAFLGHLLPLDFFKKGCCLEKAQLQLQVSRGRANVGAEDLVILWGACHEHALSSTFRPGPFVETTRASPRAIFCVCFAFLFFDPAKSKPPVALQGVNVAFCTAVEHVDPQAEFGHPIRGFGDERIFVPIR